MKTKRTFELSDAKDTPKIVMGFWQHFEQMLVRRECLMIRRRRWA